MKIPIITITKTSHNYPNSYYFKWDNGINENASALLSTTGGGATYSAGYRMIIPNSTQGYIYLIHAIGTPRYKIGKTRRDPSKRFLELNSSQSPYPLRLLTFYKTSDIDQQENRIHALAARHRVHGEWFEIPDWWLEKLDEWFYKSNGQSPPHKSWETRLRIVDKSSNCSNKLGYGDIYSLSLNLILTSDNKVVQGLHTLLDQYLKSQGQERRKIIDKVKHEYKIDILSESYAAAFKKNSQDC
ncbi:GIY-YIG nuclease family protein [Nostoc piscinale]|uniref:GIY-YIG nuclease family protein n=1 Tax=Nostoc piscinale TaxID=224012 RepID=UPI000782B0E0|nr:GIY-YIG nuclease family protein [Nostoc piscinale]